MKKNKVKNKIDRMDSMLSLSKTKRVVVRLILLVYRFVGANTPHPLKLSILINACLILKEQKQGKSYKNYF